MEDQLTKLLEKAKTNPKTLSFLKEAALSAHDFVLAGELTALREELFPDSPEKLAAKQEASKLELVFRMVGLNSNENGAWLANETLKVYAKKKGKFDLMDASKLKERAIEIFGE